MAAARKKPMFPRMAWNERQIAGMEEDGGKSKGSCQNLKWKKPNTIRFGWEKSTLRRSACKWMAQRYSGRGLTEAKTAGVLRSDGRRGISDNLPRFFLSSSEKKIAKFTVNFTGCKHENQFRFLKITTIKV